MATAAMLTLRKRNTITIEQKINIIKEVDKGASLSTIATQYGIGKSTVQTQRKAEKKYWHLLVKFKIALA